MKQVVFLLGAAFLSLSSISAKAQDQAIDRPLALQNVSDQNSCTIELWVLKRYGASGASGAGGALFGVLGVLVEAAINQKGDAEKRTEMMEIISPQYIKDTFLTTDLTSRTKKEFVSINYHELPDEKMELKNLLNSKSRSTKNEASCYYEVIVKNILFDKNVFYRSLIVDFKLKKFNGRQLATSQNDTRNEVLKSFPTSDQEKKLEAAEDLKSAMKRAIEKFVSKRFS